MEKNTCSSSSNTEKNVCFLELLIFPLSGDIQIPLKCFDVRIKSYQVYQQFVPYFTEKQTGDHINFKKAAPGTNNIIKITPNKEPLDPAFTLPRNINFSATSDNPVPIGFFPFRLPVSKKGVFNRIN
ncbi:MAG: hypothetical protein LJE96_00395 [Deltaproteobacteria bacterium]|nr:hypothetical protein [Deltaproteobacteria bacterium]